MTTPSFVSVDRPWSPLLGQSRASNRGPVIDVLGTTSITQDGMLLCHEDPAPQTQHCLGIVTEPPAHRRASSEHEVHSRVFFVSIDDWKPVGIAHGELFGDVQPTSTFIDVSRLLVPGQFVELESSVVLASCGGL